LQLNGIFILAELPEELGERIAAINERYDPKLARYKPPHVTLTGSSGVGPIPPSTDVEEMRRKIEPIAADRQNTRIGYGCRPSVNWPETGEWPDPMPRRSDCCSSGSN